MKICILRSFSELQNKLAHAHAGHTQNVNVMRVLWVIKGLSPAINFIPA
jgi:hypothetical protein